MGLFNNHGILTFSALFLMIVTLSAPAKAESAPPRATSVTSRSSEFYFEYESADGAFRLNCTHQPTADDSNDWKVICGEGTSLKRVFGVHLMIRRNVRETSPRLTLEILYWVTNRNVPTERQFTGTSQVIRFMQEADLHSIRLSESVENHYAHLTVTISK